MCAYTAPQWTIRQCVDVETCDDAEVATASLERSIQIVMRGGIGVNDAAVGQYNLKVYDIVTPKALAECVIRILQ